MKVCISMRWCMSFNGVYSVPSASSPCMPMDWKPLDIATARWKKLRMMHRGYSTTRRLFLMRKSWLRRN